MLKTGEFWAEEEGPREHCYMLIPREINNNPREMTLHAFDIVYEALGKLGYKFRDAGHNDKYVLVSLNKQITPEHFLRELNDSFEVYNNSGDELGFC